jgi:RHS repeat-associated protein
MTKTRAYTETYQYDRAGNMALWNHTQFDAKGNPSGTKRNFALTPGNNQLNTLTVDSSAPIPYQYTYDASGNLAQENTERHFEWDQGDRMRVFRIQPDRAPPSIYAQYLYDSGGQRVMKLARDQRGGYETTIYIDGVFEQQRSVNAGAKIQNNSLHVMDNKSRVAIVRVGNPLRGDTTPAIKYQLGDHLGSSNVVIDNTGAWVKREEYTPYGETSFGSFAKKRYRFTGKERDEESGLYYHGARYYAPWLARWVSSDPLGPISSLNLFRAFANNPLRIIDPTGAADAGVTGMSTDAGMAMLATDAGVATPSADAGTAGPSADAGVTGTSTNAGVTVDQLKKIFPKGSLGNLQNAARILNSRGKDFGLNIHDPVAMAHFLSQAGTESNLKPQREDMYFKDAGVIISLWPTRFKPDSGVNAGDYVGKPEKLGNYVYSLRMGNDAGTGYHNRGSGIMQTTGFNNRVDLQQKINAGVFGDAGAGFDVVANPDQINQGDLAMESALYIFQQDVINPLASDGGFPSVKAVTKAINNGENGLAERTATFNRALAVFRGLDAGP